MSAGFYKLDTVQQALAFAPNAVFGPTFTLSKDDPASKTGETGGWQWFDSDTAAYLHHGLTPESLPWTCTPLQAKLALDQMGELDNVEAFVAAATKDVQIAWEYASEFSRQSPLLLGMAAQFGWTEQNLDDLFALAKTIEV